MKTSHAELRAFGKLEIVGNLTKLLALVISSCSRMEAVDAYSRYQGIVNLQDLSSPTGQEEREERRACARGRIPRFTELRSSALKREATGGPLDLRTGRVRKSNVPSLRSPVKRGIRPRAQVLSRGGKEKKKEEGKVRPGSLRRAGERRGVCREVGEEGVVKEVDEGESDAVV